MKGTQHPAFTHHGIITAGHSGNTWSVWSGGPEEQGRWPHANTGHHNTAAG